MQCIKCQQTIPEGVNRLCKSCGEKILEEMQNPKKPIFVTKKSISLSGEERAQTNQQPENPNKEIFSYNNTAEELTSTQTSLQSISGFQETKAGKQTFWLIIGLILTLLTGALMGVFFYYPLL